MAKISLEVQLDVLSRNVDAEILAFIEQHYLKPEAEVYMFKNCSRAVICCYVRRYNLCPQAEVLLFERGDDALIELYLVGRTMPLSDEGEVLFVQWADKARLDVYDEAFGFCEEAQAILDAA